MKKEDLILENTELRARLLLAEKWMRREVAVAIRHVQADKEKQKGRKKLKNILEEEHLDIITRGIIDRFGDDGLVRAPKYTLERLIDAEIYWSTLQQYPAMDALPIVLAYQKILDAWIEDKLICPLRNNKSMNLHTSQSSKLDIDISHIFTKNYTLSIGRFYQILEIFRNNGYLSPILLILLNSWKHDNPRVVPMLVSDSFFLPFQTLIEREIFTKKRHEAKVTYADAKALRSIFFEAGLLFSLVNL